MQQKQFKYLLLVGVALIWGTVLYRILNNIDTNLNAPQAVHQKLILTDKESISYQPYSLMINYTDPFGGDEEIHIPESSADAFKKKSNTYLAKIGGNNVKPDIDFIKYKGIINNSITQKKAAIISINGRDELARLNKVVNDIKITGIKKDKIQVTYQNKKYWIKRQ